MTALSYTITVPCNPANPVDYLACCGLFEILTRLDPAASAHWQNHAPVTFLLYGNLSESELLAVVLSTLTADPDRSWSFRRLADTAGASPITITLPFATTDGRETAITLDWWYETTDRNGDIDAKSAWKMYAGQQTVEKIMRDMATVATSLPAPHSLAESLIAREAMTGRFGIDPRASRNALDVGYSPNDLHLPVATHPFAELLAVIGAQSFFPSRAARAGRLESTRGWFGAEDADDDPSFVYHLWAESLPISLARVAAHRGTDSTGKTLRSIRARRKNYSNLTLAQLTSARS